MNIKSLEKTFGVSQYPNINFGLKELPQQARDMSGKVSISGVQPKLLVKFDKRKNLLVRDDDGEYILKPQVLYPVPYSNIPENEQCCMDIAAEIGIDVPAHCLIPLKDESLAYVVKRFDRKKGDKIHQEDFFQVLGPKDKYIGSVEQIGRKLKEISSVPGLDVQLFFERIIFYFLIGNGDAHFKNYSIACYDDGQIRLTPAYDIVCTKLVVPEDSDSALKINGANDKLKRKDFDSLADYFHIPLKVRYDKFAGKFKLMEAMICSSMLDKDKQKEFVKIINERYQRLDLTG